VAAVLGGILIWGSGPAIINRTWFIGPFNKKFTVKFTFKNYLLCSSYLLVPERHVSVSDLVVDLPELLAVEARLLHQAPPEAVHVGEIQRSLEPEDLYSWDLPSLGSVTIKIDTSK
jgi:hypothetical protein